MLKINDILSMSTGIRDRTEFEAWLHCFPAGDIGQVSISENGDGNDPRGSFLTLMINTSSDFLNYHEI